MPNSSIGQLHSTEYQIIFPTTIATIDRMSTPFHPHKNVDGLCMQLSNQETTNVKQIRKTNRQIVHEKYICHISVRQPSVFVCAKRSTYAVCVCAYRKRLYSFSQFSWQLLHIRCRLPIVYPLCTMRTWMIAC